MILHINWRHVRTHSDAARLRPTARSCDRFGSNPAVADAGPLQPVWVESRCSRRNHPIAASHYRAVLRPCCQLPQLRRGKLKVGDLDRSAHLRALPANRRKTQSESYSNRFGNLPREESIFSAGGITGAVVIAGSSPRALVAPTRRSVSFERRRQSTYRTPVRRSTAAFTSPPSAVSG
jgi:hypothetical protein